MSSVNFILTDNWINYSDWSNVKLRLRTHFTDSNDFLVVNNKTLTFPTGSTNSLQLCEEIIIFGDIIPEQAELFMFSVSTADSLDVIEGPTSSTVIIQNDDPSKTIDFKFTKNIVHACMPQCILA